MTSTILYALCTLTALVCAVLLLNAYRRSGYKLLLWAGLSFVLLTVNNFLVLVDRSFLGVDVSLFTLRLLVALVAISVLLYGIIWHAE